MKSILSPSNDSDSDGDSDSSDVDPVVPDQANIKYSIIDGKPGLQINIRCTRSWTLIAARTRAKLKSNWLFILGNMPRISLEAIDVSLRLEAKLL